MTDQGISYDGEETAETGPLSQPAGLKPRRFTTQLSGVDYARLELQAAMRGTTGFKLAGDILAAWLFDRPLPKLLSDSPPYLSPSHPSVAGEQ